MFSWIERYTDEQLIFAALLVNFTIWGVGLTIVFLEMGWLG